MSLKNVEVGSATSFFLKLKDGENRIRIVSEEVPVWTSFNRVEGTAKKYITEEGAKRDPEAKKRFAMWVVDRSDPSVLKLAEFGTQIMSGLKTIANASETSFDGLPPFDVIITRTGAGMDTSYLVQASRQNTELTDVEKKMVADQESVLDFLKQDAEDSGEVKLENIPF